jgi:DNA modification methylase
LRDIIKDGEIDCSLSSPPYWDYRFYEEDEKESPITKSKKSSKSQKDKVEKQLGQEATPEEYIENLMKSYKECIRTLKDTGSIWVNIMDTRRDGEIMEIPSELIRAFKKEGMKCVERCVWFKVNPPFNDSKTYQSSEEYVIHFVKDTKKYKWFNSWFGSEDEFLGKMTYGDKDKNRRFKNIFVYPNPKEDGVGVASGLIETNVINNSYLVKLMRNNGMELLHNALYSTEIPMICILSTTEKGDSVLDNFNGLGTSGLVAYAHECKYYGIEISEQYAKQTGIRLKDFLENNPHLKRTSEKAKTPKKTTKTKG